jgi:Mrp family chromosome partitioning ATPase
MLEVKKSNQGSAAQEQQWPSSLYARPRLPAPQTPINDNYVAEDILEGCRAAIQQLGVDGLSSLGVTSALRGEGRTTIALGMALALAEYGVETVLLELDLTQPQLGQRLGVAKYPGLGEIAGGRATLADSMQPVHEGLSIVPAGQTHGSVPHALSQLGRHEILTDITSNGQVVVADLPPLLGNSMGRQAASLMADLVLVVRAGVAPARGIREAVAGLTVQPKVLLNGTYTRVPDWIARISGI